MSSSIRDSTYSKIEQSVESMERFGNKNYIIISCRHVGVTYQCTVLFKKTPIYEILLDAADLLVFDFCSELRVYRIKLFYSGLTVPFCPLFSMSLYLKK